ncbi:unnamed protein product [Paramecium pentaurelia]|uniref:Uncharacterized protein n=1 Tax=Paramecium pentaurelia TaxID=43138 RepID=A0A8S1XY41_9CILI|nr:unnamed protein product [Paramecium pentaurelia]
MKSQSLSKYQLNNRSLIVQKRLSRQPTQSPQNKDGLSFQNYFTEQSNLKSQASKKEIIRLIQSSYENIDKDIDIQELNIILTRLLEGLSLCLNEQDLSLTLIQLIQAIKKTIKNYHINQKKLYEYEKAQLLLKLKQLEQQSIENEQKLENKIKEYENQNRILKYQNELNQIKKGKVRKEKLNDRNQYKEQIRDMQQELLSISEKKHKLIRLVKAMKSRGIDVEKFYKNLNKQNNKESKQISIQSNSQSEQISFAESNLADVSQLDFSAGLIKRHTHYLID